MRIETSLTKAEVAAVLRCEGFSNGHGVRLSQALQTAGFKLREALLDAQRDERAHGEKRRTNQDQEGDVTPESRQGRVDPLTPKQAAVLRLAQREEQREERDGHLRDFANEGLVADELWPLVRRPRIVLNALVAKGLVALIEWLDEEVGYSFRLTDKGREALS